MKRKLLVAAALMTSLVASNASAFDLFTQAGARQLGGTLGLSFERMSNKNEVFSIDGKPADSISGTTLRIAPEFWYFVANNFEIGGEISFQTGFGDLNEGAPNRFGLLVGAKYLIPFGSNRFYLGAQLGFARDGLDKPMKDAKGNDIDAINHFVIAVPIGALFPLMDSNVALDIGIRINVDMDITDYGGDAEGSTVMSIPFGYLGVQSFW